LYRSVLVYKVRYTSIMFDIPKIEELVTQVKNNQRNLLDVNIIKVILDYVKYHKILFSNLKTVTGIKDYSTYFKIYSSSAVDHMRELSTELKKVNEYTSNKRIEIGREYVTYIDSKQWIVWYNLSPTMLRAILPLNIKDVLTLPPEYELLDVYNVLNNVADQDKWSLYEEYEKSLLSIIKPRFDMLAVMGGAGPITISTLVKDLSQWNVIFTGSHILQSVCNLTSSHGGGGKKGNKKRDGGSNRIQCLATSLISDEIVEYFKVNARVVHLNLFIDRRIILTTFKVKNFIVDIFNSLDFYMLPYSIHNGIAVAHSRVLSQYMLIDLLMATLQRNTKKVQACSKWFFAIQKNKERLDKKIHYKGSYYDKGIWMKRANKF